MLIDKLKAFPALFFISAAEVTVPIYNFRPNLLLKCVPVLGLDFGKLFSYTMIYSKVMFITTVIQSLGCNDLHFQLNAIRAPKLTLAIPSRPWVTV